MPEIMNISANHVSISSAFLVLLSLILFWGVYQAFFSPLSKLPGPRLSIWTDAILTYHWLSGNRVRYVHHLHETYGPIVRIGPNEVSISDISTAREIHSLKGGFKKSSFYQALVPGPQNVFNALDVEFHRRHRRMLSSSMSESSLKAVEPLVRGKVAMAVDSMRREMQTRGAVDIFKLWLFMATDIIAELSFGESFKMLELGKKNAYTDDLETLSALGSIRTTFPTLVGLAKYIPLPVFKRPAETAKRLTSYAEQSIQRYKTYLSSCTSPERPLLLSKLLTSGPGELTDDEIRADAQAYIVAGSDTTANSLTYLVWAVCKDNVVKERLVAEISGLEEGFGDAEVRTLPYLSQVIEETLRLYAAAPSALPRAVPSGGSKLCGHWIPGGVTVSTQAWTLHRDPSVFVDPEEFKPSRWETPSKDMKDAFMPFGGGSRVCLGLHLARMELRLATALFFRTFPTATVSQLEGMCEDDMKPLAYFLLSPKGKRCLITASGAA